MVHADVVIRHGRVIDGTGNPWTYGDVVIANGTVVDIAPPGSASGREIVDATGHVVCPGFIDIQSHSIVPFLTDRRALSKVTQGVTTYRRPLSSLESSSVPLDVRPSTMLLSWLNSATTSCRPRWRLRMRSNC